MQESAAMHVERKPQVDWVDSTAQHRLAAARDCDNLNFEMAMNAMEQQTDEAKCACWWCVAVLVIALMLQVNYKIACVVRFSTGFTLSVQLPPCLRSLQLQTRQLQLRCERCRRTHHTPPWASTIETLLWPWLWLRVTCFIEGLLKLRHTGMQCASCCRWCRPSNPPKLQLRLRHKRQLQLFEL